MNPILSQIELSKKRLAYFNGLKDKLVNGSGKPLTSVEKWIAIYQSRLQQLEKTAKKSGLNLEDVMNSDSTLKH